MLPFGSSRTRRFFVGGVSVIVERGRGWVGVEGGREGEDEDVGLRSSKIELLDDVIYPDTRGNAFIDFWHENTVIRLLGALATPTVFRLPAPPAASMQKTIKISRYAEYIYSTRSNHANTKLSPLGVTSQKIEKRAMSQQVHDSPSHRACPSRLIRPCRRLSAHILNNGSTKINSIDASDRAPLTIPQALASLKVGLVDGSSGAACNCHIFQASGGFSTRVNEHLTGSSLQLDDWTSMCSIVKEDSVDPVKIEE